MKKAALTVCLFLFINNLFAQEFVFTGVSKTAYDHVLNLRFDEARKLIPEPKSPQEIYVISLSEAFQLLLNEDETKMDLFEANFDQRRNRSYKKNNANELLLQTELHIQWAFIYLKYGSEFDAALQLRQAYLTAQDLRKKFPHYKAVLKTAGLLNVMIGSVPEKYNWVLSLLSMQGSVPEGIAQMQTLMGSSHDFRFEATLWYSFIQGFVLQQPQTGITEINKLLSSTPANPLATFLAASIHIKNASNEEALHLLSSLDASGKASIIPYIRYLKGETLLHKGEYESAISSYKWFIENYNGQNFLKDAYFKTGLCYWLLGNQEQGRAFFHSAKTSGKEDTEADKNAAKTLAQLPLPPIPLIKVRYFTDGGYFREANAILSTLSPETLGDKKSVVEYYYRVGRLAHKMNDFESAKSNYKKTIELSGDAEWYFAPNAALQLGYITMNEKNYPEARKYFEQSMSYKRHEYKNSIDSKARSALNQLKGLK